MYDFIVSSANEAFVIYSPLKRKLKVNYITVHDKTFQPFLTESEIQETVKRVGQKINQDYAGKTPLFIGVLNGAFMFCSDLLKTIDIACDITFVRLSSYDGMESTGEVRSIINLQEDISGRDVILVEDIVDSGLTMQKALTHFGTLKPASMEIASLLVKPDCLKCELDIKYQGFEIPEKFVVGYGLDYNGHGRNFKEIYQLRQE